MNDNFNYWIYGLTILFGFLTWLGIKLIKQAYKDNEKIKKYEFQNRTSGGVVEYESYEKAKEHRISKKTQGCLFRFGFIFTIFIGIAFVIFLFVSGFLIYQGNKGLFKEEDKNSPFYESRVESERNLENWKKEREAKKDSLEKLKSGKE
ncbi:hypothetical protein [Psychroserpens mesophilus]|uniref:hypothetical protein n=1 Tax=Psychroserpens mesophilus TaxID=325473 RepID=UPI00058F3573|nr:hypothetical protein [Psychroserpens mesophilus]